MGYRLFANMFSYHACIVCGREIKAHYTRCYRCNEARKRGGWHNPEDHSVFENSDAQHNRPFYVYILETDYGHYVGHTGNIEARIRTHLANGSPQTASGYLTKVWQSSPFKTREAAAHYEAVLKCWRDKRDYQFEEKTKMKPKPFKNPNIVRHEAADGWVASLFTILITCILLFLFLAFIFKL